MNMYSYDNNGNKRINIDIFRHAVVFDLIKITLAFLSPAIIIHILVFLTIPDLIKDQGRIVIFVVDALGGAVLTVFYIKYVILQSILGRIVDKEAVINYQAQLIAIDANDAKTIDTEDRDHIEELSKRTGMSTEEARLAYYKTNFDALNKRINTLQLPPVQTGSVQEDEDKEQKY